MTRSTAFPARKGVLAIAGEAPVGDLARRVAANQDPAPAERERGFTILSLGHEVKP